MKAKRLLKVMAFAASVSLTGAAYAQGAQGLFGYDSLSNSLFTVEAAPVSASLIGSDPASGVVAEIEFADGVIYANDTNINSRLHVIDPGTGLVTSTITLTFPPEGDVITSMEYIGGTLYGGLTTEGGAIDTYLSTIDTTTGAITVVGPMAVASPVGGLAYDKGTGTLYAMTAGGSNGALYTVDIGTGRGTFVGQVQLNGRTVGMTALEFGTDGLLYGFPNKLALNAGHLLEIDKTSAVAIDLGDTGVANMSALTALPAGGPGFAVEVVGNCPGMLDVNITGATPGGRVAIVYGTRPGPFVNPGGICTGITLDIRPPFLPGAPAIRTANAAGVVTLSGNAPAGLCGRGRVQAVDLTTCDVSNLANF